MIHIGMTPNSAIVPPEVKKNKFGEIEVNARCETSVPGLFAAGDVNQCAVQANLHSRGTRHNRGISGGRLPQPSQNLKLAS